MKRTFLKEDTMNTHTNVKKIAEKIASEGGRAFYVGGYVRDRLLGCECKDIDIEVHGISAEKLREILCLFGEILVYGESFGIFSLKGYDIDFALPRKEKATGRGHRDFEIDTDPFIGTQRAAMRRDFTVNSMMEDVLTGEIIDHYAGLCDLENRVLRHVNDESFPEDPLRVLRLAQFAARFGFSVHPSTAELCRGIDLSSLSKERVEAEMKKALLKASSPSVFFGVLKEVNGLDVWFCELERLSGLPQNPVFHPEGDVWTHTMNVLDAAVNYRDKVKDPFSFMLACLCHDFGKAVSTEDIGGVIHAYAHETKGIPEVKRFVERITNEKDIAAYVLNMTQLHMKPYVMINASSSVKSFNKLFDESVAPKELIYLSSCDNYPKHECTEKKLFERYEIYEEYMSRPFVKGSDLIAAGLTPQKNFSEILSYAHKLRLAGIEKESALKQTLAFARKLR